MRAERDYSAEPNGSGSGSGSGNGTRRPFRAADVLTGAIDRRPAPARTRKQISAQLEPDQVRMLGEMHARLNATADKRIEKSDLVGLGIELLAAALEAAGPEKLDPASDDTDHAGNIAAPTFRDAAELRAYLRTWVRERERVPRSEERAPKGENDARLS
ncbi:MAG TPA: hypothetical protein VFL82_11850 [Thermomicrobiales bacterium]|nr:hypothetical protein [Thermomicrobiales bacterium]